MLDVNLFETAIFSRQAEEAERKSRAALAELPQIERPTKDGSTTRPNGGGIMFRADALAYGGRRGEAAGPKVRGRRGDGAGEGKA